jgi:hypothetical protein
MALLVKTCARNTVFASRSFLAAEYISCCFRRRFHRRLRIGGPRSGMDFSIRLSRFGGSTSTDGSPRGGRCGGCRARCLHNIIGWVVCVAGSICLALIALPLVTRTVSTGLLVSARGVPAAFRRLFRRFQSRRLTILWKNEWYAYQRGVQATDQ